MHRLINRSRTVKLFTQKPLLHSRTVRYNFAIIANIAIQKSIEYQFHFRTIVKFADLQRYVMDEAQGIKKYGKTVLLEFLNEYPMQSFRRSRDESDGDMRQEKKNIRQSLYLFLNELEGLNFYQKNMRYSIFRKMITYFGPDPTILKKSEQYESELVDMLKNQNLHVLDVMNWLYMLPLDYPEHFGTLAFHQLERHFENKEVREYLKGQRALPMLIKRIYEMDWNELRKYKNIINFLCHEATNRSSESIEEIAITLERMCQLKLHLIGERVIPKIIDDVMNRLYQDFEGMTKNKMTLLKVFSCFRYMPINYNISFFNKIHNFLKSTNELPSHCLMYLPYNKLNEGEVTYLQTKMFAAGREDIAPKLIYTVYEPYYKSVLTPLIVKQAYLNMLDLWKKDSLKQSTYFQVYIALTFRFVKMNNPIIDVKKLKKMFEKLVDRLEEDKFEFIQILSAPGIIAFFQLCHIFQVRIDEQMIVSRVEYFLNARRQRNSTTIYSSNCIQSLQVHYNALARKSRQFLTNFIHDLVNNPQVEIKKKFQLLFLIEKSFRADHRWIKYSAQLYQQNVKDMQGFVESFIKYDSKTVKLTSFVFGKLYEKKVDLPVMMELLGSLNLKLVTSLKGKLITALKKYITQLDISQFDLTKSTINTLIQSFKILFYFRNEIPEFMQHLSISLIQKIEQKINSEESVNGKQFASLSMYVMEILAKSDIKQKTEIIESIVSIIKTLRKKEGLYMKVYELDFLCSHQKHIKVNNEVLEHHWSQIVDTLKKTDRIEHHKDLFFIVVKLHCREFVELNTFDLRYFIDKCTELVEDSVLNLSHIKQCLGYEILNCEDEFVIQKLKLYFAGIIKLAFRKEKRKQNYFMYEYFLKLFSKLESTQMITEICSKLLNERLYPLEISNIVPILSRNEIKNKRFVTRIINIMVMSDAYVTFESNFYINQGMQVISWLEKILYQLPQNDADIQSIKRKIDTEIINKTLAMKEQQKLLLNEEERSVEDGFQVDDPEFDKNYKVFIDYVWSCIKSKTVNTPQFKFICRYLFFSIDKIKARVENPIERKQISKIKLHHVFKYMKECGFFEVNEERSSENIREQVNIKEKLRKNRLLSKMENYLSLMRLQHCEKLQKKLEKFEGMAFKHKAEVKSMSSKVSHIAEYLVQQRQPNNYYAKKKQFIIHTVKKYHYTPELDVIETQKDKQKQQQQQRKHQRSNSMKKSNKSQVEQSQILKMKDQNDVFGDQAGEIEAEDLLEGNLLKGNLNIEESELSLDMKPDKIFKYERQSVESVEPKQSKVGKPLFGSKKSNKVEQKAKPQTQTTKTVAKQLPFQTALKLQPSSENLYKDYNGYLKVEKSLIELITGLKCIIYDPQRDLFFE